MTTNKNLTKITADELLREWRCDFKLGDMVIQSDCSPRKVVLRDTPIGTAIFLESVLRQTDSIPLTEFNKEFFTKTINQEV